MHPAKTILNEQVCYFPEDGTSHVAFVIKTHADDPHKACLVYYCPDSHAWKEAYDVRFGKPGPTEYGRDYYVNVE